VFWRGAGVKVINVLFKSSIFINRFGILKIKKRFPEDNHDFFAIIIIRYNIE
jgi:hypothetical protein